MCCFIHVFTEHCNIKNRYTYIAEREKFMPAIQLLRSVRNKSHLSVVILLLLFLQPAFSVNPDSLAIIKGNGKIEAMDNYLSLRISISNDIEGFALTSDQTFYNIQPNISTESTLSFNYRFISFSLKFAPSFLPGNNDDNLKGVTKTGGINVNLIFDHLIQSLSYSHTTGYYLKNSGDYLENWTEGKDSYIQFPELNYLGFRGFTGYKINEGFSLKSLGTQTERQIRSAGSFIPFLFYNYYIIDNKIELTGLNSSQKSANVEIIGSASYFYTLCFLRDFYISAGVIPGAGFIHTKLLTRTASENYVSRYYNPIFRLETQMALGYNSRRFFGGSQLIASWERYDQNRSSTIVTNKRLTWQVFLGFRFNSPRILRKATDKVREEVPLI
jgi:hypothetical protein